MKNIEVIKLNGNEPKFYTTLAPLLLTRECVRYLGNTPIVTSEFYQWYILKSDDRICAFVAVENDISVFSIKNFYIDESCAEVRSFETLIKEVMNDFKESDYQVAHAFAKTDQLKYWEKYGFEITKARVNWNNLKKEKK